MLQETSGNSHGFTLIELMIVIAIIGILAAIAIPNFIAYRDKAYCTKAEVDAKNVMAALASYFSEPENTSMTDIDNLHDQEKLVLNNNNVATVTELPGVSNEYEIQIQDGSDRCPRADHNEDTGEKHYFIYMGTDLPTGWKVPS